MRAFLFHTITTLSTNNQTIAMSESSVIQEEVKKALDFLNNKLKSVTDLVYPVGSIYISVSPTDPSRLFGGTWVALNEGRVLIGASASHPAGETGGEETHTLTTSEMPSHTHGGSAATASISGTFGLVTGNGDNTYGMYATGVFSKLSTVYPYGGAWDWANCGRISMSASHSHSLSINSTGGGSSHNNMQPYLSVYMWKRTA